MLIKPFLILAFAFSGLFAKLIHFDISPKNRADIDYKIKIENSYILDLNSVGGEKFFGISALAYDKDDSILYMLSDRSRLFAFKILIKDKKISSLKSLYAVRLKDRYGHKFFIKKSDSEGMSLVVDKEGKKSLLISFENNPRILEFDLKGKEIAKKERNLDDIKRDLHLKKLPKELLDKRLYRGRNSMLESVTTTKKYGMITTAEFALKGTKTGYHGLYNQKGRICFIKKSNPNIAITELETIDDETLLAIGRDFDLFPSPDIYLSIYKISLNDIKRGICETRELLNASTKDGWILDNFEGVTRIKENLFLMVSDDNNNPFQKTILVLFSLKKSLMP